MHKQTARCFIGGAIGMMALLAVFAKAETFWWDGPTADWETAAAWSTVSNAATPDPESPPAAGDTAVLSIEGYSGSTRRGVRLGADQSIQAMRVRNMGSGGVGLTPAAGGSSRTLLLGAGGLTLESGGNLAIQGSNDGDFTLALTADQIWRNFLGGVGVFIASSGTESSIVDLNGRILTCTGGGLLLSTGAWNIPTNPKGVIVDSAGGGALYFGAGGSMRIYNRDGSINSDRIGDTIGIVSHGGSILNTFNSLTADNLLETVGTLTLAKGAFRYGARRHGTAYANVFTFGGLSRTSPTACLLLDGTTEVNIGGYFGETANARNRVLIADQSTTPFLGGWAVLYSVLGAGSGFLAYDTTEAAGYARGLYPSIGATIGTATSDPDNIYNFNTTLTATGNLLVGALCVTSGYGKDLNLGGYNLTLASGGLLFGNVKAYRIIGTTGKVTAGLTSDAHYLFATSSTPKTYLDQIDAEIADNFAGGTVALVKNGTGTLTLSKANTYTGATVINEGTLSLDTAGSIADSPTIELLFGAALNVSAQTSVWTLGAGQTLMGNGTLTGDSTIAGTVAPGSSAGTLSSTGDMTFSNNARLEIEVKNAALGGDKWEAGYDRLEVTGTVDLGAHTILDVEVLPDQSLAEDDLLFIVANDETDAIAGLFKAPNGSVLSQDSELVADGLLFAVSYTGDLAAGTFTGGNDVALKFVGPAPSGTLILVR